MSEELRVNLKFDQVPRFTEALQLAPRHLLRSLGRAFYRMGRSDIEKLRTEQLSGSGSLRVRSNRLRQAFKFKVPDARQLQSVNQLYLLEYTGWKAARIFQTGGIISARKSKSLVIPTDAGRRADGTRKFTAKKLAAMIQSGEAKIIKTVRGPLVIRSRGGTTKTGKMRKGSRTEVLAVLRPRVTEKKRLDFFANFSRNEGVHQQELNEAVELALQKVVENKAKP